MPAPGLSAVPGIMSARFKPLMPGTGGKSRTGALRRVWGYLGVTLSGRRLTVGDHPVDTVADSRYLNGTAGWRGLDMTDELVITGAEVRTDYVRRPGDRPEPGGREQQRQAADQIVDQILPGRLEGVAGSVKADENGRKNRRRYDGDPDQSEILG